MKRFKEITLENIGALKSMINAVKREADEKKDYIEKSVILVGKEAIEKAIEKYNYYLDITANGAAVSNDVLPESFRHFYCMTDEQIKFTTMGLVIGLRARYKKPKADVYKEKNGEYKLYSTYQ